MPELLSGAATFRAMKDALEKLVQSAPESHDVLIVAFGVRVNQVRFIEPHTFEFIGSTLEEDNPTAVVCHYSQVIARVVFLPKRTAAPRIITGFASVRSPE
ncbi:MAG TPA: hypothetical protein VEH04_11460 [Verrucomicrobiae bacterium]|nr:hypothetical protein [Verrucomicrobiae bacterium]